MPKTPKMPKTPEPMEPMGPMGPMEPEESTEPEESKKTAEGAEGAEGVEGADLRFLELPVDLTGWPLPGSDAVGGPVPPGLIDWFARGASALAALFESVDTTEAVWTYGQDRTIGFWVRVQSIEAAIHRWDAEGAIGAARPIDAELAADAVRQTFEVMAPARREWTRAPQGAGERYRFRQTDGVGDWAVEFDGGDVRLGPGGLEPCDVEVAGTASDLMLFLWHRIPADRLAGVKGDRETLDRWFTLVPPV
ncbi:maleylpyruvate isomerase family mycothiol-dependent enzyme [Streptomyces sp. SID3343]|nr:maleylpyruvate isomerase family mycothiol-dependent enzyme [Streptomyces sp. SID3343]